MKADEVYAKLKKMIGLVSVGIKNTTSTQNPDGSVTITINFNSGSPLSFTMTPAKGDKGVGIKDAQIKEIQNGENTEYHLILIDDKDNNIDAGNIPISSVGSYPDTTNLATKSDLITHADNANIHVTSAEKSKWNAKLDNTDLKDYAKKVDVNSVLNTKVDKVNGKSLVDDTEIARLATINNYDDSTIKQSINSKASISYVNAHTSDTVSHITDVERRLWNTINSKADMSDIPDLTNYATKAYVTDEIVKASTGGTVDSLIKVIYLSNLIADNKDSTKDEIDLIQGYIDGHKHDVEIVLDKSFTTTKQIDLSNCNNIKITGYIGNNITYNPEELTSLFKIDNSHDIYFDCLTCNSDNDNAILIGNRELAYHITIRNCRTYDCASLLMTHKIHDVTAENNFCYNSKGTAFAFLNDPYNLIVNNNVIEKGVNVQIKIYSTFESVGHKSENIIITNNRICDVTQGTGEWDMAMGIEINENSYNCVVSNNVLARCADMGISLSGAHKVTCNGNVIEGTNLVGYGSGIEIVACDDFICDSNIITGISHYGIILDKTYEGVVSSNNIVMIKSGWEPENFCIMIGGMTSPKNCHDLVISNNKLKFGTYGIRFNENLENIKIIGNLFENIFYKDISHDSPSSEILKSNITIENNTFDTSIDIGGSKNIFINSNIFNIPNNSEGDRPYVSAIYIQKNSQYINIINNTINNAYFIVCFEKDDAEHTKATRIRIINNIIDYNSSLIDNADGLSDSDYYLTGNVDSSYSITPLNIELYDGSKVTTFSETVSINYDSATPSKLIVSSATAWDYAYFDIRLTAGTYKFVYTSDNLSVNADYCVGDANGTDMIRGTEGNILTLVDGVYRFRFFVNGEEVPVGGQTTTYDNISLVRIPQPAPTPSTPTTPTITLVQSDAWLNGAGEVFDDSGKNQYDVIKFTATSNTTYSYNYTDCINPAGSVIVFKLANGNTDSIQKENIPTNGQFTTPTNCVEVIISIKHGSKDKLNMHTV